MKPWEKYNQGQETSNANQDDLLDKVNRAVRAFGGAVEAWDSGKYLGFGKKVGGLINAIGAYPVDRVAELLGVENTPSFSDRYNEIVEGAKDMRQEFAQNHPVADTLINFAGLVKGPTSKILDSSMAKAGDLTQQYGKAIEILSKLGTAGAMGAGVNIVNGIGDASDVNNYLKSGDWQGDASLGAALNVALPAAKIALPVITKGVGKTAQHVLGKTTGAGDKAIGDAFDAGTKGDKSFITKMRGDINAEGLERKIEENFNKIKQNRSMAYDDEISRLKLQTADKKLDIKPVVEDVRSIIRNEGGGADYLVDKETSRVLSETKDVINKFYKDPSRHNLDGFDNLKKRIANIATKEGSNADRVKTQITNSVKGQILKQSPGYQAIQNNYAKESDLINDLKKVFSLNRNANSETVLKKIQSTARNNANTDWSYRAQLLRSLDPTGEIQKEISANALNSWGYRGQGIAGLAAGGAGGYLGGLPGILTAAAASSPRIVGESAYLTGALSKQIDKLINRLPSKNINIGQMAQKKDK